MWTPQYYGHFSQGPFIFPFIVDILQLLTLFVRPSGVHISEVLLNALNDPCNVYSNDVSYCGLSAFVGFSYGRMMRSINHTETQPDGSKLRGGLFN